MKSFKQYLTENISDTIQKIQNFYNEFNAKYFNDELPHILHISYQDMKDTIAEVDADTPDKKRSDPKKIQIVSLCFTSNYEFTDEQLIKFLLHEMIHIKLFVDGIIDTIGDPDHGKEFDEIRKRLIKETGYDIPLKETDDIFQNSGIEYYTDNFKRLKKDQY